MVPHLTDEQTEAPKDMNLPKTTESVNSRRQDSNPGSDYRTMFKLSIPFTYLQVLLTTYQVRVLSMADRALRTSQTRPLPSSGREALEHKHMGKLMNK